MLAIIALLAVLVLPLIGRARDASRMATCLSNLRQVNTGFLMYAREYGELPDPSVNGISWERCLTRYAAAQVFECPSDQEIAPTTGSSYDWRDTGIPETTLAGRRLSTVQREGVILAFEALPGWHAKDQMNVALLNGSVASIPQDQAGKDLLMPITVKDGSPIMGPDRYRVRRPVALLGP